MRGFCFSEGIRTHLGVNHVAIHQQVSCGDAGAEGRLRKQLQRAGQLRGGQVRLQDRLDRA